MILRADGWSRQKTIESEVKAVLTKSIVDGKIPLFLWSHDLWFVTSGYLALETLKPGLNKIYVLSEALKEPKLDIEDTQGYCRIKLSSDAFFQNSANYREVLHKHKELNEMRMPFGIAYFQWQDHRLKSIQIDFNKDSLHGIRVIQAHDSKSLKYQSWILDNSCKPHIEDTW